MPAESLMSFGSSSLWASQPHFRAGEVDEFIEIMLMAHRHTNWRAATAANDGVIAPQTGSLQALATAYVNREDRWDVFGKTRKLVAVVIRTLYYSTLYVVHAIFRPHKQQGESDRWRPFCRKARIAHAQQHSSRVDKCEPNLETNTRNIERVKPRSSQKADMLKSKDWQFSWSQKEVFWWSINNSLNKLLNSSTRILSSARPVLNTSSRPHPSCHTASSSRINSTISAPKE